MRRIPLEVWLALGVIVLGGAQFLWWSNEATEEVERLDEIEQQIDSMLPADRGLAPTPTFPEDTLTIRLTLYRKEAGTPAKAYTLIEVGGLPEPFALPRGWKGRLDEMPERVEAYDAVIAKLRRAVARMLLAGGGDPAEIRGAVAVPSPQVPEGDIVQALNVLLELGLVDVALERSDAPKARTASERAAADAAPLDVTIAIDSDGNATLGTLRVALGAEDTAPGREALRKTLQARTVQAGGPENVAVHLHAAWGTKWKTVQWVMTLCKEVGVERVKLHVAKKPGASADDR